MLRTSSFDLTLCSPFLVTWSHTCGREDSRLSLYSDTILLTGMSKAGGNVLHRIHVFIAFWFDVLYVFASEMSCPWKHVCVSRSGSTSESSAVVVQLCPSWSMWVGQSSQWTTGRSRSTCWSCPGPLQWNGSPLERCWVHLTSSCGKHRTWKWEGDIHLAHWGLSGDLGTDALSLNWAFCEKPVTV